MNQNARILLAIAAAVAAYLSALAVFRPIIAPSTGMMAMMPSPNILTLNILALMLGAGAAAMAYALTRENGKEELAVVKKVISPDEKAALEEVQKAGEITQDSLRYRLGWSKAKTSSIITSLDRMNLIQRERQGKTYNIFVKPR